MREEALLLAVVFIPVIGSFLVPVAGRFSAPLRNWLALGCVAASLVCSVALLPAAASGRCVGYSLRFPVGYDLALAADALAVFMAVVSSLVGTIIVLYSFGYISRYQNQDEYYFMVVLFLGSMMGLVFSANLILLYVFWEITAIASWRLIGFYREKRHVVLADKAFLVTFFGAVMMLLGFIMLAQKAGSFDLAALRAYYRSNPVGDVAILLILLGILSKSATLPFHTWLPDAGIAPSPVTALLHAAVLVKIGVYVFARLFVATLAFGELWRSVFPWIAAASALVSAGAAFVETDMKRIIAYSTVSQIAFIFLGFSMGNGIGVAGALLYILMHGLAKGGLFLCAGIVEQNAKTKDITRLGGLITTMPATAVSFLCCSFSVMGIPPFRGFFSKYMVMSGAVTGGRLLVAAAFLAGACLTILYLFRLFNAIFLGEARTVPAREGSGLMVACVAALAALSLLGGLCINYPALFAGVATKQMCGM